MELNELLEQIDRLKAEIDDLRPIDSAQERRILQKFRLDWTFHSNSIEGNKLTYGETKAFLLHGITAQGKPFRDYLDIRGHHQAIDYLLELVRRQKPLTEADVRELHKVILVEPYDVAARTPDGYPAKRRIQPGQYKTVPNHVETSSGEIHYYATPEETPAKMADLMSWYRGELDEGKRHPLILAATFHYQFVTIHPFDDGNGRMARLLMNLIFMQAGFPPVIIHTEDRNDYLLALEQADSGDLQPFIDYVGDELLRSLNLFLRGAKGGSIDEENDISKKLFLLEKKIEAYEVQRQEQDVTRYEKKEQFLRTVLEPFLSALMEQTTHFDHLFNEKKCKAEPSGYSDFQLHENDVKNDVKLLIFSLSQNIRKARGVAFWCSWRQFLASNTFAGFELILEVRIDLMRDTFEIVYATSEGKRFQLDGPYDQIYSDEELRGFSMQIANDLIQKIDALF